MKANELYVLQTVDSGVLITLIGLVVLAVGYGFYRRMKISEKNK